MGYECIQNKPTTTTTIKNPLNLLSQFRDFHNSKDISKKLEKSKDHVYY